MAERPEFQRYVVMLEVYTDQDVERLRRPEDWEHAWEVEFQDGSFHVLQARAYKTKLHSI